MVVVAEHDVAGMKRLRGLPGMLEPLTRLPKSDGFLGFVPLAVGVVVLTCYYWMTAICSMMVNVLKIDPEMTFGCLLILIFNISLFVTWTFATCGVIQETSAYLKTALILWTIFTFTWTCIVLSSFYDYGVMLVCVNYLCPESFWLYNNTWHKLDNTTPMLRMHTPSDNVFEVFADRERVYHEDWKNTPSLLTNIMSLAVEDFAMNFAVNEKLRKDIENNKAEINILTNNVNDGPGFFHKSHTQFVVFLIMVIFNGGTMYYSWFMLYSHYFEVQCIEQRKCNEKIQNVSFIPTEVLAEKTTRSCGKCEL